MLFLLISVFIFVAIALYVPKRLEKHELYPIALFSIVIGFTSDIIFDLKYDVYGYFTPGVQFLGFLPILVLFPTSGVIYMNFYPYKKPLQHQFSYILAWTLFSLTYEHFSIKAGFFYHNGWTYLYSAIAYPLLLVMQLQHLKYYRKYIKK